MAVVGYGVDTVGANLAASRHLGERLQRTYIRITGLWRLLQVRYANGSGLLRELRV